MSKKMIPTSGTRVVEKDGFHRRVATRSYCVVLTEIGGNDVRSVRLDNQLNWAEAKATAEADNPGWRFKGSLPLTDRDFEGVRNEEQGN